MKIQNIHNGVINELTKKQWDSLGKRQKVFKIIEAEDSPKLKEQTISNEVGKTSQKVERTSPLKPEKDTAKKQ